VAGPRQQISYMAANPEYLKLLCLLCMVLGTTSASVTINGSSAGNWPSTGGSSIFLTGQIGQTNASCARFSARAGGTATAVTRWVSETSIAFRPPSAASSRIVFAATASTLMCTETEVPVPLYPSTHLTFTKVTAGQGMGCAITSEGALYCWGCFSGLAKGNFPDWRISGSLGVDFSDQYHCVNYPQLPAGPSLPTLVAGMESGVTQVTHLSTMSTIKTKEHMGLALKSGKVYELYLDISRGDTTPGFIAARLYQTSSTFAGIFVAVADSRLQQSSAYSCAVRLDSSIYCHGSQTPSGVNKIQNIPDGFVPVSVHCSHYFDKQHCCTYNSDGVVYCWGWRSMQTCSACNRLGDAETNLNLNSDDAVLAVIVNPMSIPVASGQPLVVSMDIGYAGTYVVGGNGNIYCWACRNTNSLTTVANAPSGQKFLKLTSYQGQPVLSLQGSRLCALTNTSRLYCAIVPLGGSNTIGPMFEVLSVRNFQRQEVQLSTRSGVLDVSCSKHFAAAAGPYMSCCIIVRSSFGSKSGDVHCTVRTQGKIFMCTCGICTIFFRYLPNPLL
jgi:hypothetical protein